MRIGIQLPSFSYPGGDRALRSRLAEIAQAAEAAGFDSLWVMDHLNQLPADTGWGGPEEPMLEAYSTLGYLAGVTERIRLGPLVGCALFRQPGLLIKAATTVDVLSGGRIYFTLGAGWYAAEARGLGLPFPPQRERFERLEETLQLAHQLWSDDRSSFRGRHYTLAEPIIRPLPVSRPHPPIMLGGNGERRTLRLTAQYADAHNFLVLEPHQVTAKLEALRRHCQAVGRDYATIERTTLDEIDLRPGRMTTADVVARARAQAAVGIQHWIVNLPDVWDLRYLERLGRDVVPAVAELEAAA
jgi:F420-dependent oxidoreductase-like protein